MDTPNNELIAYRHPNGREVFAWCRYCKKYHTHGVDALNHRVAHCWNKKSPYKATGYVLIDGGKPLYAVIQDYQNITPRGPQKALEANRKRIPVLRSWRSDEPKGA